MKNLLLFPYTFVLLNWAAVVGLFQFVRGQEDVWSGYASPDPLPKMNPLPEPAQKGAAINKTEFSDAA